MPKATPFTHAIVRHPATSVTEGLRAADVGSPDPGLFAEQHAGYVRLLEDRGLSVLRLPALEAFPDSVFVEDVALCTGAGAVLLRPGADSRTGEVEHIAEALTRFYPEPPEIQPPGVVDGGDLMQIGAHVFVGLSDRTNVAGAGQLAAILGDWGISSTTVSLTEVLHLKTGVNYLDGRTLLVGGEFVDHPAFAAFERIVVPEDEAHAANSLWINGRVLVPRGYPKTRAAIEKAGFETLDAPTSEPMKLDGGLSCMSLRFTPPRGGG